jgi:hypothetical protein
MKKVIIILCAIVFILSIQQAANAVGTRYDATLPQINQQFISYFPDMVFGKYIEHNEHTQQIPNEVLAEFLPDILDLDYYEVFNVYAIGKIINYKGLDLFLCEIGKARADEDSYDNHVEGERYLFMFRNGVPLIREEHSEKRLIMELDATYNGEGGHWERKSYFDTDSVIIRHFRYAGCCSDTGYDTPMDDTVEERWTLKGNGEYIVEITQLEFSSPFYDRNYLKNRDWSYLEEIGKAFPTKDEKWRILYNPPVHFYFYVERINDELITVFESYIDDRLIDLYMIGQPRSTADIEKNYSLRPSTLKCPIIIKTSDGDLELLPDGKIIIQDLY